MQSAPPPAPPPPPPPKVAPTTSNWTNFRLTLSASDSKEAIDKTVASFIRQFALTDLEKQDAMALGADAIGLLGEQEATEP